MQWWMQYRKYFDCLHYMQPTIIILLFFQPANRKINWQHWIIVWQNVLRTLVIVKENHFKVHDKPHDLVLHFEELSTNSNCIVSHHTKSFCTCFISRSFQIGCMIISFMKKVFFPLLRGYLVAWMRCYLIWEIIQGIFRKPYPTLIFKIRNKICNQILFLVLSFFVTCTKTFVHVS